jgi:hypothetical protein
MPHQLIIWNLAVTMLEWRKVKRMQQYQYQLNMFHVEYVPDVRTLIWSVSGSERYLLTLTLAHCHNIRVHEFVDVLVNGHSISLPDMQSCDICIINQAGCTRTEHHRTGGQPAVVHAVR